MSLFIKDYCIEEFEKRGVTLDDMAELLLLIQQKHSPDLTIEAAKKHILKVFEKREVQNVVLTGLTLDKMAENHTLDEPLHSLMWNDDSLYGVDEVLAYGIANIYGSIGLTNFGYLDKAKPGIIGKVNDKHDGKVNTFLDDLISAVVAAAASRVAHRKRDGYHILDVD